MTKQLHGCACCGAEFGTIFRDNHAVKALMSPDPATALPILTGIVSRRDVLKSGIATLGALSVASCGTHETAEAPATVFTGGTVLTVDADFSEAEAIAIRGNKIIAVGSATEVRAAAGANAELVDLAGRTMLPGFIDAHTHVVAGSIVDAVMEYVGMAKYGAVDEVLDHIAARVATGDTEGAWELVRILDEEVERKRDAGIDVAPDYLGIGYAHYLVGDKETGLAALEKTVSLGFYVPVFQSYLEDLVSDPAFAPLLAAQQEKQKIQQERFLTIMCGPDNPVPQFWQPSDTACGLISERAIN